MHPLVRDLYKRFVLAARTYPGGRDVAMKRAKEAFLRNQHLQDELSIKRAVAKGRYWVRELHAAHKLHKYRTLRKRYEG